MNVVEVMLEIKVLQLFIKIMNAEEKSDYRIQGTLLICALRWFEGYLQKNSVWF